VINNESDLRGINIMNTIHTVEKSKIERNEFKFLFAICYSFLIFFVLINRMLPKSMRLISKTDSSKSIFGETKELTYSAIPFVFMC
jgi:hypothetical protein